MSGQSKRRLVEIKDLSRMLADRIRDLVVDLFPAGTLDLPGREYLVGSLAGEAGKSLSIHLHGDKAGVWSDFATGEAGDAFDLVAQSQYHGDKAKAVDWACQWLGLDVSADVATPSRPAPAAKADGPKPGDMNKAALRLWLEGKESVKGTPADTYLRGRAIDLDILGRQPAALRYHPALWNTESNRAWPGLLAAISGPAGKHVATHRTWLNDDGRGKAPLENAKATLGRYRGGYIRLWRGASDKAITEATNGEAVAIAEGIEDGLSAAIARPDLRVIVAVSLANMGAIELPPQIDQVLILAQNEKHDAAERGRDRAIRNFLAQGKRVSLVFSPIGKDINDLLQAKDPRDIGSAPHG